MHFEDVDAGEPADGLVRINIKATGVNFFDSLMVAGQYQSKPPLPFVPGAEISGEVLNAPAGSGFSAGEHVMALVDNTTLTRGGYAQVADAIPQSVTRIPEGMPFEDGAAFTLIYQTGWFGLHRRANLQAGETLLVHAGAGGVGSGAIQLGKAAGARVIATAGSDEKLDVCRKLGADHAINYKTQDFAEEVKSITGGRGADVIYDPVGGETYQRSTKCVAFEGRILVIGFAGGRIADAPTNHALIKNYSIVGLHWGLYMRRAPELIAAAMQDLLKMYDEGRIKPYISKKLPLADAPQGLTLVGGGKSTGKVVLVP